jgi:ribose transport system permease protein
MLQPPLQRTPSTEEASSRRLDTLRHYGRQVGLPLVVAALVGLFAATSDVFFSVLNFRNIGVAAAALAAVSFGQTFTILTAGLDLSVGSTVALVSIVGALACATTASGSAFSPHSPAAPRRASSTDW